MKKYIPMMALALLSINANAQKITASSAVVDLGQVMFDNPANGTFLLKNNSTVPLNITKVDTGCGCTVASYPQQTIGAGEQFAVNITYDARLMGHFDRLIDVYTDADNAPTELELKGVVVEEMTDYAGSYPFQLGNLQADCNYIEFEDVPLGEVLQQKFHIFNATDKSVQPQILHLPNYLRADVSPTNLAPEHSGVVTITLDSRLIRDYGLTQTSIYLGSAMGEKVGANKEIDVSAVLLPASQDVEESQREYYPKMQISETHLDLSAKDGKKKSATVEITNNGRTDLEIRKIQMYTTGLKVQLGDTVLSPGETTKLKITTNPKMLKNLKTRPRVLLITNDPDQPKVVVDVNVE